MNKQQFTIKFRALNAELKLLERSIRYCSYLSRVREYLGLPRRTWEDYHRLDCKAPATERARVQLIKDFEKYIAKRRKELSK